MKHLRNISCTGVLLIMVEVGLMFVFLPFIIVFSAHALLQNSGTPLIIIPFLTFIAVIYTTVASYWELIKIFSNKDRRREAIAVLKEDLTK